MNIVLDSELLINYNAGEFALIDDQGNVVLTPRVKAQYLELSLTHKKHPLTIGLVEVTMGDIVGTHSETALFRVRGLMKMKNSISFVGACHDADSKTPHVLYMQYGKMYVLKMSYYEFCSTYFSHNRRYIPSIETVFYYGRFATASADLGKMLVSYPKIQHVLTESLKGDVYESLEVNLKDIFNTKVVAGLEKRVFASELHKANTLRLAGATTTRVIMLVDDKELYVLARDSANDPFNVCRLVDILDRTLTRVRAVKNQPRIEKVKEVITFKQDPVEEPEPEPIVELKPQPTTVCFELPSPTNKGSKNPFVSNESILSLLSDPNLAVNSERGPVRITKSNNGLYQINSTVRKGVGGKVSINGDILARILEIRKFVTNPFITISTTRFTIYHNMDDKSNIYICGDGSIYQRVVGVESSSMSTEVAKPSEDKLQLTENELKFVERVSKALVLRASEVGLSPKRVSDICKEAAGLL